MSDELLPIDEAFALTAEAVDRNRIEFRFEVADGYYLYRHRMGVVPVSGGFKFNPLELPAGKRYTDEFFGELAELVRRLFRPRAVQSLAILATFAPQRRSQSSRGILRLVSCVPPAESGIRSNSIRMSGDPASPRNSAYSDHSHADSTPTEISVSIVAAPCRALAQAARWNGSAPHTTTGAARVRESHCQLSNWSHGTMAIATTGTVSTAETTSRCHHWPASSSKQIHAPCWAASLAPSPRSPRARRRRMASRSAT